MWNKISHAILNAAIVSIAFAIISSVVVGLTYWREWVMPAEAWGEYKELRAVNWNVQIGEPLWMLSSSKWKRDNLRVKWNDILRCKHEKGGDYYGQFSNYVSSATINNNSVEANKPWRYHGRLPTKPMECKMESQMEFTGAFGIKKHYVFESEAINFIE